MYSRSLVTLTLILLLTGCGPSLPSEGLVSNDFQEDYPTARLTGVGIGEGPRGSAFVHFSFLPENSKEHNKVVWTYAPNEDGAWVVTKKGQPMWPLD